MEFSSPMPPLLNYLIRHVSVVTVDIYHFYRIVYAAFLWCNSLIENFFDMFDMFDMFDKFFMV